MIKLGFNTYLIDHNYEPRQGLPWLRMCCSQHFSQMEKSWSQMKLTLAKVLARK